MTNKIKLTVFLLARTLGLFAACRRLTRHKVRILCYHGGCLGDESSYNPKLFCSSAMLIERMQWLKKKGFALVSLTEAAASARQPAPQRRALTTAITFDDGWYSTARELVPILGKLGIPSTLYLCTSHYTEGWAILSVAVRYLIWKSGLKSAQLHGLGRADGSVALGSPVQRNEAANRIVEVIDGGPPDRESKHAMLEQLASCLKVATSTLDLATRRFEYVNEAELLALAGHGCAVELHGHVHNYPTGNPVAFEADLRQCSDTIIAAGLPRPTHYCYPSGNFDAAASTVLDRLGIVTGTTCLPGMITQADATQSHYLPRFLDGESIAMLEFEAEMSGFSELLRNLLRNSHPLQPT